MTKIYNFAELNVGINSIYSYVHKYCADYLTDSPADFTVNITRSAIDYERTKPDSSHFPDEVLELSAVYRQICERMPMYNTFLIHGSCLGVDGRAYLFTAPSGTGKSTHSRLWRELLGERVIMINDDKPLIRVQGDEATIYGTPYSGKDRLNTNTSAALKAICFLERSESNHIEKVSAREVYPQLLRQTYRPGDKRAFALTLGLLDGLCRCVKFYRFFCNMDISAADLAYQTLKGED